MIILGVRNFRVFEILEQLEFLSVLLAGKFRRGVTERVRLKRIFRSGEYTVIQQLCIAKSCCLQTHKVQDLI